MRKYIQTLSSLLLLAFPAAAQQENIWTFGRNAGLDFSNGVPAVITPNIEAWEACASVSDLNGHLLFYTEGYTIRDRNHNLMQNGSGIVPFPGFPITVTASTVQGALIVPFTDGTNRYYVFSLTQNEMLQNKGRLYYSIVDMSLNNGLGNVVAGQKGMLLDTGLTEQMTAVPGADCDLVWLLTASQQGSIKAYAITAQGIGPSPVLSPGTAALQIAGGLYVSPDRKHLVSTTPGLILYDFDAANGMAFNPVVLSTASFYGAAFSPDNTKLYASGFGIGTYQFDLNTGNTQTLITTHGMGNLKRGPDQKIYLSDIQSGVLHVINNPDVSGNGCQFTASAITFPAGSVSYLGLPNAVPFVRRDTLLSTMTDTLSCATPQSRLNAADTTGRNYIWNDGSTGKQFTVTTSGSYWVSYHTGCHYHVDSFHIYIRTPVSYSFNDTCCSNDKYKFNGRILKQAGLYRDTVAAANGCDSVVILNLTMFPAPELRVSSNQNGTLCIGDTLLLTATDADRYQWFNIQGQSLGNSSNCAITLYRQKVSVRLIGLTDNNCTDTTEIEIHAQSCCTLYIPNAFTPNDDARNDRFRVSSNGRLSTYHMEIYNRWGQILFTGYDLNDTWDGNFKGSPAEVGTYFYQISHTCPDGSEQYTKGDITLIR